MFKICAKFYFNYAEPLKLGTPCPPETTKEEAEEIKEQAVKSMKQVMGTSGGVRFDDSVISLTHLTSCSFWVEEERNESN